MSTKRFAVLIALALGLGAFLILVRETARWIERTSYPETALHDALKRGDLQELPKLIAMGFDIEDQNDQGETVLLTLVKRGPNGKPGQYLAALEALVDARADVNVTDKKRRSPVQLAIARGGAGRKGRHPQTEALAMLLKHGADPNASDPGGWTPLARAGRRDLKDAETLLIEAGATIGVVEALVLGDIDRFADFLRKDLNLVHLRVTDQDFTLLIIALMEDEPEIVRLLIEAGADPNYQDLNADSPLHHAISAGASVETVRALLDAGADPNLPAGFGESPLHLAAASANPSMVSMLLDRGADVRQKDRRDQNALHYVGRAMTKEHWNSVGEVIRMLIDSGASPHARDQWGRTPLYNIRDAEGTRILIEYGGADVSVPDKAGDTLLHLAMRDYGWNKESFALAEIYLEHGSDISLRNGDGYTPLDSILLYSSVIPPEWLTLFERYGVPQSLVSALQSGRMEEASNILQRDPKQASTGTLAMAIRAGEPKIARQILELGANPNAHRFLNFGEGPVRVSTLLGTAMRLAKSDPQMASQIIGLLLEYGLDADSYLDSGNRALYDAVRNRQGEIVNLLLVNGADPNAPDQDGRTALDFSMKRGLDDITELLIAHGARQRKAKAATN